MSKKILLIAIILTTFFSLSAKAQQFADASFYLVDSLDVETLSKTDRNLLDSILPYYHKAPTDSAKLLLLNTLVEACENNVWIKYNQLIIDIALKNLKKNKKNVFKKFLASGYNNLGFLSYNESNFDDATSYFEKTIEISYEINDLAYVPVALNSLGYIFKQQGNILKALDYYHKALEVNKKIDDKSDISLILNNIGGIYFNQKEYIKALNYYREALLLEKSLNNEKAVARLYSNIGSVYQKLNKYTEAKEYYIESYNKYVKMELVKGQAISLSKIVLIEFDLLEKENKLTKTDLTRFLNAHKTALQLFKKENDTEGIAYSNCNIANILIQLNDIKLAKQYAYRSLQLAQQIGFPENIKNAAESLKKIAEIEKNYNEAFEMQNLYYQMQDSLNNVTNRESILQKQYQYEYEYEKKLIADSIQNTEKEKLIRIQLTLKDEQIKRQNIEYYSLFGGVIVLLIFGGVTYRRYKKSQLQKAIIAEQKKLVEHKSREITDSINYAKHIQNSLLPPDSEFNKQLKDGFVYYQPKDIVAGDFYWIEKVNDLVLFAVADCTGHGVPGAIVSVVCNDALARAIGEYKLTKPSEILDKAREIVIKTFDRSGDEFKLKDGMDIALCSLKFNVPSLKLDQPETLNLEQETVATLQYAGANNPLWIISKNTANEYELIEFKADKQPISNYYKQHSFTNHTLKLKKGDSIYIFSDGYVDQFGGEKGKKMMYKSFKNLLLTMQDKKMADQKKLLKQYFENWKGNLEQIDDVCVVGVRI